MTYAYSWFARTKYTVAANPDGPFPAISASVPCRDNPSLCPGFSHSFCHSHLSRPADPLPAAGEIIARYQNPDHCQNKISYDTRCVSGCSLKKDAWASVVPD